MDSSQVAHPHGHHYEQDPHNFGLQSVEGEDEQHHEKKSVLKKVKAKAKKIKDTLKLHGHDHDYDQHIEGHVPDDHDLDEEDDEEAEMVEDPKTYGASADEAAAIRSSVPGQEERLRNPGTDNGRSGAIQEDFASGFQAKATDPMKSFLPGQEEDEAQLKVAVGETTPAREVPHVPGKTPATIIPGIVEQTKNTRPRQPEVTVLEGPTGWEPLEEDPQAPKGIHDDYSPSNYQSKVTDPTDAGGEEAGISPILRSLNKMNIHDESKPEAKEKFPASLQGQSIVPTGSHDQFSPELTRPQPITTEETPQPVSKTSETSKPQYHALDDTADKPSNQSSYTQKISSATSTIANKAILAKNVVASKLGYGQKDNNKEHETQHEQDTVKLSKVQSTSTSTGTGNEAESKVIGQNKGVSMKDYFTEKLRPGDEDRALSEVISEVLLKRKTQADKEIKLEGKVTESEELKRQLGSTDEKLGERVDPDSVYIPRKSVVDNLKVAVGSWLVKGEEPQTSLQSLGSSTGTAGFSTFASGDETGDRRL